MVRVAQEIPFAQQPEDLGITRMLGGGEDDAQVFGRTFDFDGRAFVFGFVENGFFILRFVPDFAHRSGALGFGQGDEITHAEELPSRPFDCPVGVVRGVEAGGLVEEFEQFARLGEVELEEGGDLAATPLGEGEEGGAFAIGEFAEGRMVGFLGGKSISLFVLELDLGGNGVSLNAPG
jgi:hypothetical protein